MCGISGLIGTRNVNFDPAIQTHRGPDNTGTWESSDHKFPVTLAHNRLSILDLNETANQPMISEDGRYILVYNGEIYNYNELKNILELKNIHLKTQSDTEVLLKGLIYFGVDFLNKCNGMWAFCFYDNFEKRAILSRDRFGKKPLYFARAKDGGLMFASEMKMLLPLIHDRSVSDDINVKIRLPFSYEASSDTIYKNISRLRAGHILNFSDGEIIVRRWWCTLDNLVEVPNSYDEQVQAWKELFIDAVKIRMRADVKIGTALSGGLDSSSIMGVMHTISSKSDWRNAVCSYYPKSSLDESAYAKRLASSIDVKLELAEINPSLSNWDILSSMKAVEDPYLTLPIPMLDTYEKIRQQGIKVTIDGHGADELFSGYGHLKFSFRDCTREEFSEISSILRSMSTGEYAIDSRSRTSYKLALLKHEFTSRSQEQISNVATNLRSGNLNPFAYTEINLDRAHPRYLELDSLTKKLYELFHCSTLPTLLRNYDRYSMANGVEVRMPFLDYRLVCFTFSLGWRSKVGGTYTKRILRDAMKEIIPEDIRTRRDKVGWNAPLHEWLKGPLREQVCDILAMDSKKNRYLERKWQKFLKNDKATFGDGQKIWQQLQPVIWRESIGI
jgi:asparagine synthase (glutamine-hydrolysing)